MCNLANCCLKFDTFGFVSQDEDENAYNTSDEEFERQLEEAAVLNESKAEVKKPKTKRTGQKKKKKTKTTNKYPDDPDAEGYEVKTVS